MKFLEVTEIGYDVDAFGTSLQGYVTATYEELEDIFEENLGKSIDNKVYNEFRGEILAWDDLTEAEVFTTVTVYDYKEDNEYNARNGLYRWNVGGMNAESAYLLEDLLEIKRRKNK